MKPLGYNAQSMVVRLCAAVAFSAATMAVHQNFEARRSIGWIGDVLENIQVPAFAISATLSNSHNPPWGLRFLFLLLTFWIIIELLVALINVIRFGFKSMSSKRR